MDHDSLLADGISVGTLDSLSMSIKKVIPINAQLIEQKKKAIADIISDLQSVDVEKLNGLFIAWDESDKFMTGMAGINFNLLGYIHAHLALIHNDLLSVSSAFDSPEGLDD